MSPVWQPVLCSVVTTCNIGLIFVYNLKFKRLKHLHKYFIEVIFLATISSFQVARKPLWEKFELGTLEAREKLIDLTEWEGFGIKIIGTTEEENQMANLLPCSLRQSSHLPANQTTNRYVNWPQ